MLKKNVKKLNQNNQNKTTGMSKISADTVCNL